MQLFLWISLVSTYSLAIYNLCAPVEGDYALETCMWVYKRNFICLRFMRNDVLECRSAFGEELEAMHLSFQVAPPSLFIRSCMQVNMLATFSHNASSCYEKVYSMANNSLGPFVGRFRTKKLTRMDAVAVFTDYHKESIRGNHAKHCLPP